MSDEKPTRPDAEARLGKAAKLEDDIEYFLKKIRESKKQMREYKLAIIRNVCDEIVSGDVSWIPYFYEQFRHGRFEIGNFPDWGGTCSEVEDEALNIQKRLLKKLTDNTKLAGNYRERVIIVSFILNFACRLGNGEIQTPSLLSCAHENASYAERIGVIKTDNNPRDICTQRAKEYLPIDGLHYSYYLWMNESTKKSEKYYWESKLRLARGENICIDENILQKYPDLILDLKKTRRWDLFRYYEKVMNRRQAASLLLCARAKCEECPFFRYTFSLDILKIIFELAELTMSQEEKDKLRGRAYFHLMEK